MVFNEYDTPKSEIDLIIEQFNLDMDKLYCNYIYESNFGGVVDTPILESEAEEDKFDKKQKTSFKLTLINIAKRITRLFSDIIELFTNMLPFKKDLDIDQYMRSATGVMRLDADIKEIDNEVQDQMRKGRKIVQLISKSQVIDDEVVADYIDETQRIIMKTAKTEGTAVIKTSLAYKKYFSTVKDKLIQQRKMINEIIDIAYTANGQKQRGQAIKIARAISDLQVHAMRVYNMFLVNMQKEMVKAQKLAKKNKDKGGVS